MRNILLATAALSLFAAPALAQTVQSPTYYGTLGYTQLDTDNGDLGAITGRVGAKLTPNLGVEAEGSLGVRSDDVTFAGIDGKMKEKYDVAAYGVATLPVNPNFDLFARVGYGTTKLKAEVAGGSRSDTTESWNYGVGGNYYLDGQNGIRADWTRRDFVGNGNGEADAYSISYVRKF